MEEEPHHPARAGGGNDRGSRGGEASDRIGSPANPADRARAAPGRDGRMGIPGSSDDRIVLAGTFASPSWETRPRSLIRTCSTRSRWTTTRTASRISYSSSPSISWPTTRRPWTCSVRSHRAAVGQRNDEFPGSTSGLTGGAVRDLFSTTTPAIRRGRLNTVLTANLAASGAAAAGQMQVFAGCVTIRSMSTWSSSSASFRTAATPMDRSPASGPRAKPRARLPGGNGVPRPLQHRRERQPHRGAVHAARGRFGACST